MQQTFWSIKNIYYLTGTVKGTHSRCANGSARITHTFIKLRICII